MNFPDFTNVVVNGVPLLVVILGLVEYLKRFGVSGNALLGSSMGIGAVLGVGYQISQTGTPVEFSGWFAIVLYGLVMGLIASGVYDALKSISNGRS
jgi:hypothetical protein